MTVDTMNTAAPPANKPDANLEAHFECFRLNTIGHEQVFDGPFGIKKIIYADWTASGRLYRPIEQKMVEAFGPFVGNTHTETNITGTSMTLAYHKAKDIIKHHVNAGPNDCLISYGSGMTGVINKFQRILGLKLPERWQRARVIPECERPVVFITHMEHHSNQTSWLETIADVKVIPPTPEGDVDLDSLRAMLNEYADRQLKIAAVTACSNVTGIQTPYHLIAKIMHAQGGLCFVDFACSAPYVHIDMHPDDPEAKLDAIYFSPHKFLGGPGTAGILLFDASLYRNRVPDNPGGGTVKWTNPWQEHDYVDNIEEREDGGTPPFLQTIRTALCIKLKESMGIQHILNRESQQVSILFNRLGNIPGLKILSPNHQHRLGVLSFVIEGLHYNLGVRLLNDKFGVQVRGGCSCAGTYGHYLLEVDRQRSHVLTCQISQGDLTNKPGWIRLSIHPTMSNADVHAVCDAVENLTRYHATWSKDYQYNPLTNDFTHAKHSDANWSDTIDNWFEMKPAMQNA
jgi:selenocysteine lyase/cysteine desulfurase